MVGHHQRFTVLAHLARSQFGQIGAEQGQAMGRVAEQIAFQQDIGNRLRLVLRQTGRQQQLLGKRKEVGGGVFHGPIIGSTAASAVAAWTLHMGKLAGAPSRNRTCI